MFATIGRKPRIASEHDSGSSLIAAVAAGHEFALLPSCVSGTAGPRLKFLKLRPALPPWSIVALWRKDAETESVRAFIAAAYLGLSKLPGLFSVPRHSGLRSLLASDKARFTPVTSKSLQ
jgi:DNA-binding transcriptional LysR family regulator